MDTQIQQTAKPSSFVKAGGSSSTAALGPAQSWFSANRAILLRLSVGIAAVVLVSVAVGTYLSTQSAKSQSAFSGAMDVYDVPLRQAGQPVDPNTQTFGTAVERARVANPLFRQAASQYGFFKAGANARYFAGLTEEAMGQTAQAESDLKQAANGRDSGLSSLARMALAGLYRKTGRQQPAIDLYQQLIAKPTLTVPTSTARLALAETYEATRPDEARRIYAQIKDSDKTSAAAQIAAQKLDGKK